MLSCMFKKNLFLAVVLLAFTAPLDAAPSYLTQPVVIKPYSISHYNRTIAELYAQIGDTENIAKRIDLISAYFLGKPYLLGALGEGPNGLFDKNPLYRTDAFDCTTFVNTVLALAEADNLTEFQRMIIDIRYKNSVPDFFNNHHFISIDWNLYNQKKGYLRNVTSDMDADVKTTNMIINKPAWYRRLPPASIKSFSPLSKKEANQLLTNLHQYADTLQPQVSQINYIPLSAFFTQTSEGLSPNEVLFNQIPNGAVIEVVRAKWNMSYKIGTNLNISHMGFAIRTSDGLMFRNASSLYKKVVDLPLALYLANYFVRVKDPSSLGINIQMPLKK